ncbi:MAG TPA: hypothetical protein VGM89_12055 [Puia sp.]
MKRIFLVCLCLSSAGLFSTCFAQDTLRLKGQMQRDHIVTDRPPQLIYGELGGAGLVFSVNYDARFQKRPDGLGWRLGVGYSFTTDPTFITVPFQLNYLVGRNGHYFEVGAGVTYVDVSQIDPNDYYSIFSGSDASNQKRSLLLGTMSFGYRSQPLHGGFNFRGGLIPIFGAGGAGLSFYISLGYNF